MSTTRPPILDSIFWIEVEKIKPNPYQPRREFNEAALNDLADSIRQYGVLQPLVVTRNEIHLEDGGMTVEYELIAGERRLRACKIAGVVQVPAVIRSTVDDARTKLEIAIIENLQREDLNSVERARAFARLAEEFKFKHLEIAKKVGKSREYVSNTLRLLLLPDQVLDALSAGKISEGHARTILMLHDRPDEQIVLFKEVVYKKLTVRETERIARKIAYERVRKKDLAHDPELVELEENLSETLGTRVHIERRENGGRLLIDFFSNDDLRTIFELMKANKTQSAHAMMDKFIAERSAQSPEGTSIEQSLGGESYSHDNQTHFEHSHAPTPTPVAVRVHVSEYFTDLAEAEKQSILNDKQDEEKGGEDEEGLYSVRNFGI